VKKIFLVFMLLALPFNSFAEVKIIEVKNRSTDALAEKVRPLLNDGEKIEAAGTHLILIATGDTLQAAEKMIALLDVAQQNLLVRVRQSEQRQMAGQDASAAIRHNSQTGVTAAGQATRRLGNSRETTEQSLTLLEGSRGLIEIGRDVPYTEEWAVLAGEVAGYAETTAYKSLATGFWIYPEKVQGETVLVDIEPYVAQLSGDKADPPEISFANLRTRLQVPLGQWYPLGDQLRHRNKVSQAIISWRSSNGQADRSFEIRIDLAE